MTIPRLSARDAMPDALRGGVVALGNFDGFHLGHQAVAGEAIAQASAAGKPAIIATFDPHPVRYFAPHIPYFRLTTLEQRQRLFADAGADYLTVHVEACPHLHRTVQAIKERGVKAGVTLNPATSLSTIEEIITEVDLVLIMSVNPGFGGQTFIPSCLKKIASARGMIDRAGSRALLEVDGGVKIDNANQVLASGADVLVAGSAIFSSRDYAATIAAMRAAGQLSSTTPQRVSVQR